MICHDIKTGQQNQEQVLDIGCDSIECIDDFIITRCREEQECYLIWKFSPEKTELELIDEITLDKPDFEVLDMKIKGGILA